MHHRCLAANALAIAFLIGTGVGRAWATEPVGLPAMEQFHRMHELRQGVRTLQTSSRDLSGGNTDSNRYLQVIGSERVLVDVKGPGCIYRIWVTGLLAGRLRVYFDGATTPTIDLERTDFFSGLTPPLLTPIVGDDTASSGGFYCYLPMPFREGCRITSSGIAHYYNITYQVYDDADGITTFTGSEDSSAVRSMWNAAGTDPKPDTGTTIVSGTVSLAAGASTTLADLHTRGIVQEIQLDMPGLSSNPAAATILSGLRLVATWDDASTPAVDATVGEFFGCGLGYATVRALPIGMINNRLYCYFPMPFGQSALIRLVNNGPVVNNLTYTVRYSPLDGTIRRMGYFHARSRAETPTTSGRDYIMLDETGAGHFVGVVHTMNALGTDRSYLEGDERIYVDGSQTPALYGTGTEDFYNGGWYFSGGTFSLPVHGNAAEQLTPTAANSCYRFLLSDCTPFTRSIRVGIEHGGANDVSAHYRSVAFYYQRPDPLSTLTDEVDVGTAASETAHAYSITGQTWAGTYANTYEGDDDNVTIIDNGRRHAGTSEFHVAIDPQNAGVLLRRRFDYTQPRQQAEVYVDGVLAGTWYDPGMNTYHSMRDSEFLIPASRTAGKSQIDVRIEDVSTESEWSELRYWVFTLLPLPADPAPGDIDEDGDVDVADFGFFQLCFNGPSRPPGLGDSCHAADLDRDGDVDLADFGGFLACFNGPGRPAACTP